MRPRTSRDGMCSGDLHSVFVDALGPAVPSQKLLSFRPWKNVHLFFQRIPAAFSGCPPVGSGHSHIVSAAARLFPRIARRLFLW